MHRQPAPERTQSRHDLGAHRRATRLAGIIAQWGVDELDGARDLVGGYAFGKKRKHRLPVECRTVCPLHQRVWHLAQVFVGHANHQTGQHIRVRRQGALDLGGVYVAGADREHIDPAIRQIEEPVFIEVP